MKNVQCVKLSFAKKLKKIEKGKTRTFKNLEEMEKYLDDSS